jgi:predicted NAD-dependent protein-ADP-ribosyltransferase YbiA (DUF1768 family)
LGKINTSYIEKQVSYISIYLLEKNKIKARIGVFEIPANKSIEIIDNDGEVDVEKLGDPLLFKFVDEDFIVKKSKMVKEKSKGEDEGEKKGKEKDFTDAEKEEDESDQVVKVKAPRTSESLKNDAMLQNGIFYIDDRIKPPALLVEETEKEADQIKKEFNESAHTPWICKFMKNGNFGIHEVEANGDCFFAVLRDAFKQVGHITTVDKLRALLAKEATESVFEERRTLFLSLDGKIKEYEREMKALKTTIEKVYKVRAEAAKAKQDRVELQKIVKETNDAKAQFKQLQSDKADTQTLIDENIGHFAEIDSLEKFRAYIRTPRFWADSWAIATMERLLKIKMVILSERSYDEKAFDSVINCGEVDEGLQKTGTFSPDYYIMTTFSGDHYRLITYKDKRIFKFHEIPFYVKNMIINKCIEKNSGVFHLIQDFRDLKSKMGIDAEDSDSDSDDIEVVTANDTFDPKIVFVFHGKADKSSKPGKASNEKIPTSEREHFTKLGRIPEWRRKLDDSWEDALFTVDGKKWGSVEHYYQGAKFKNGFPDFMLQFSLDSDSDISKSVDLAVAAGGPSGKKKNKILRPVNVNIDSNFYGDRSSSERELALEAKFTQNEDMKQLLLATRNSKLMHFIRGQPAEPDHLLMKVRQKLR